MSRLIPKYFDYPTIGRVRNDAQVAMANSNPILIARGLIDGATVVHKFGRNADVANATWEGVLQTAAQFPWLTAATTVRVKAGGNAADDVSSSPLGAGAHEITVQGLSAAGVEITESVATAGSSASASTTAEFLRVYRCWVSVAGAYTATNTGTVVIENTAGTQDLISIAVGEGQSQFCAYTIPAGKTGYLSSLIVQADGLKAADFRLFTRADATQVTAPFNAKRLKFFWDGIIGSSSAQPVTPMLSLPALTDVWIEARGAGAGTEVAADMEIILFDD